MADALGAPLPVVPFLKIPAGAQPYLEALRCGACGKLFLDQRRHCAACGARDALSPQRLSDTGRLHAFTIIQRSFPGVKVPYVSAIVDLDGGGTLKGNLIGVEPSPERIAMGMRVKIVYELAPQADAEGQRYLAYFFAPAGGAA
jgi:uncharacterized OB-fold protein